MALTISRQKVSISLQSESCVKGSVRVIIMHIAPRSSAGMRYAIQRSSARDVRATANNVRTSMRWRSSGGVNKHRHEILFRRECSNVAVEKVFCAPASKGLFFRTIMPQGHTTRLVYARTRLLISSSLRSM